jgi:hypothetical protein
LGPNHLKNDVLAHKKRPIDIDSATEQFWPTVE